MRWVVVAICASCALGLGGWAIARAAFPAATSVTCTNDAGATRTWTSPPAQFGGSAGSLSASAAAPGGGSKTSPPHPPTFADLQWTMVGSAIAGGIDPVTAARQFGPWTVPGATGAQLAHAMDPATYG